MSDHDTSGHDDRRTYRRFGMSMQVRQIGHRNVDRVSDVSLGGLFLRTTEPRKRGGCVPLRLVHPMTGEVIAAVCQVVHQVYSAQGEFLGLGLRFANADSLLGDRIRELIHDVTGDDPGPLSGEQTFEIDLAELGEAQTQAKHGTAIPVFELELEQHAEGFSLDTGTHHHAPPPAPKPAPKDAAKAQQLPEPTFRDCYSEALAAERARRPRDAVAWLQQALERAPDNPLDIHLRIAAIAMRELADLELANEHMAAARALDPKRRDLRKLRRELRGRRRELLKNHAKLRFVPLRPAGTAHRSSAGTSALQNPFLRRAISSAAIALIVASVFWNAWTLNTSDAPPPLKIDPQKLAKLVAADRVLLSEHRLVVNVAPEWLALPDDTKAERLKALGDWAAQSYQAREIILTDDQNVLVGEVANNRVAVYR